MRGFLALRMIARSITCSISDPVRTQGFYVLVDFHARPGDTTVSSGNLVGDWTTLWRAMVALPSFSSSLAGRVFLDLINEPDGINVKCAPASTPAALLSLRSALTRFKSP